MDRSGIFAGSDPFALARRWLSEAEASEPGKAAQPKPNKARVPRENKAG